jgi:predicted GNAT family acetyltransferase
MTFSFQKERLTAISPEGVPMGYIAFPRIRAGLVNVDRVSVSPEFRGLGVEEAMMVALFSHLSRLGLKAALTCPFAQQYLEKNPKWKTILPGEIHFTRH